MIGLLCFVLAVLASPFKSKLRLEAENAVLRHQLIVLKCRLHGRVRLTDHDRWFLIQLYRWFPSILQVLTIIRPETLVRWHRAGFRCYWRWKSRPLGGNGGAAVGEDVGDFFRSQMSVDRDHRRAERSGSRRCGNPGSQFPENAFRRGFCAERRAGGFGTTDYDFLCLGMELA
jgi:hypothetical protein